jgi:hypothetical protein
LRFNKNLTLVLFKTAEYKLTIQPFGYHKFLLAAFGFLLGSWSGFFAGLIIGILLDVNLLIKRKPQRPTDNRISYLMLAAFVLQEGELGDRLSGSTLRGRLVDRFGENYAIKRFAFFNELLRQRIQVDAICEQIKAYATENDKKDIIRFLFEISYHPTASKEKAHHCINYVAARINIQYEEVKSIYSEFKKQFESQSNYSNTNNTNKTNKTYQQPRDIYSIFNLTSSATEKELKTSFHKLAKKYHPDSNPTASASEKIILQEKLRKVIEAYEEIKTRRGWK